MDPVTHGTRSGYQHWKCRCWNCTDANSAYQAAHVAQLRVRPIPADAHGKVSTYTNRGCRCDACTEASTVTYRRWVAKVRGMA